MTPSGVQNAQLHLIKSSQGSKLFMKDFTLKTINQMRTEPQGVADDTERLFVLHPVRFRPIFVLVRRILQDETGPVQADKNKLNNKTRRRGGRAALSQ